MPVIEPERKAGLRGLSELPTSSRHKRTRKARVSAKILEMTGIGAATLVPSAGFGTLPPRPDPCHRQQGGWGALGQGLCGRDRWRRCFTEDPF